MFSRAFYILKYWLGWILLFELARVAFVVSNYAEAKAAGLSLSLRSLLYGLRMDMSMAAYITLPFSLLVLLAIFFKWAQRSLIYTIYTAVILAIILTIIFADLGLYKAWGSRLDTTPLKYLTNPKEVWASISHLPLLAIAFAYVLVLAAMVLSFSKLLQNNPNSLINQEKKTASFFVTVLLTAVLIIPIRGGLQLAPLNHSSVYFSQNNFANMAAINAPWNLMYALNHNADDRTNPFRITEDAEATKVVDSLFGRWNAPVSFVDLKSTPKPNVVIIAWESLTSKAIGMKRNGMAVLPGIETLMTEGIFFSNIYASGDRTDKGIVAILSGFPAQPTTSIVKVPAKAARLPMLSKVFHDSAYHTSFYYGGELEFANMKAYLLQGSFDRFISVSDFAKKDQNSKWGAHDGVVMQHWLKDLNNTKQPFFSTWLTLSSHEPYEIPAKPAFQGTDDVSQYLSSLHYSDSIVFRFITQAKQQPWWANSIVVIVADHGHRLLSTGKKADDFHIPLIMLGGAVKSAAAAFNGTGSQTDLAATLLAQLRYPYQGFRWSRNLADTLSPQWAYFTFNNGFGYVTPGGQLVFDNVGKRVIEREGAVSDLELRRGRLVQQVTFQDYLDK